LILLSATTQTTLVRGNQIISQNWRPTYDLVVLPPGAKLPTDQQVPADLSAGYGGGISVRQYDQVKNLAGVEVAAPITYVGYVQMPVPQIYFSDHSFATGYYQLDWTLTSFNGLHHIVELQERDMIYIVSGSDSTTPVRDSSTTSSRPSDVLATFGSQINEEIDEEDNVPASMSPIGTGTFLLAAIDPAAENQLVHLDKSITAGRMLTEQDTVHLDSRIPGNPFVYPGFNKPIPTNAIPMLFHRQLPGQITLNATLTLLALTPLHMVKSDNVLKPGGPDAFYNYEAVGEFTDNGLAAQINNPLNWLPENTYAAPPVVLRYDAQGHPITPTTFLPTTNPAGFIVQPPLALTTIAAARELVGEHCISAIRVRVAGVVTPNQESWKHIQQVAQEIRQQTGVQVVVTLGSSPQPTLVYVPGVHGGDVGAGQNIAPIGWVEERRIHIGVGLTYLNQLGSTWLLLLGAVLAVCLGYLAVAFSALVSSQRRDFAILSVLGWRPGQPIRLFLAQDLILAIGGGILGLGLALLLASFLEVTPLWPVVIGTIPVMLALAFISILYPLWQIWHMRPAEILRAGSSMSSSKAIVLGSRIGLLTPIGMLVLRNLSRSRLRSLITVLSLFLSAFLLVLMFTGILSLHQALHETLLGDYVLLQTAVPQIAGCVIAIILTFLSVADLLLLHVRERQREIGLLQAVGWGPGWIQRLFVQEGLTLAIIGAIPGVLVAQWILHKQHATQSIFPAPVVALGAVLLMVLVAAFAAIPALRALSRMQVADVLRSE
jgi:hypothetical protein